jgi:hypothetical protein
MTLVSPPVATTTINQNFFIEALGGSQNPVSYLDSFPDSVYTKALDSVLVKFLYAILGPTGVGLLRQQYLEARLMIEESGLQTTDLDNLYTNAFAFARAAEETYQIDASANLLPANERAMILAQDSSFRNRAIDFLKGARGGATSAGLTLVAKSGVNRPVELVENYRSLFDHYTDVPLGLQDIGQTKSVAEVVIIPRQTVPNSTVQTLSISGEPTQGFFSLTYPAGQNWLAIPYTVVGGNISVPDLSRFPAGVFVTLTNIPAPAAASQLKSITAANCTLYTQSLGSSGTTVVLGTVVPATTGSHIALVGVAQTVALPFNCSAATIQNALTALPVVGAGSVIVSGGPFPDQEISVQFAQDLSDQDVSPIIFNLESDPITGIVPGTSTPPISDVTGNTLDIGTNVLESTVGYSADLQPTVISDADRSTLYTALGQTAPMNTLFTTTLGTSDTVRQPASAGFTASNNVEVIRYETGRAIQWPSLDATHWIEPGIEHEAPAVYGSTSQYQGFHNINTIIAYTEGALTDLGYFDGSTPVNNIYWNSLVGTYSPDQLALYPGLAALNAGNYLNQYLPSDAEAPQPEPLIITTNTDINVINQVYPLDYMTLLGVPQPTGGLLWASGERVEGIDYLEVDLGTVQPVNYLYFEATNKPYLIDVAYDTLDQSPSRNFIPTTIVPPATGSSTLSLNYQATLLWSTVTINLTDSLGGMIYTRFVRIGFTKAPVGTIYSPIGQQGIPYSVEVRNLRVGRNVS